MSATMRSVQLVELGAPEAPAPPRRPSSWLKVHAWASVAVAAVLVAVLVVLQAQASAAERRRLAALREVPGILQPLGRALDVAWRLDADHADAVWGTPAAGVLVSGVGTTSGFALEGIDLATSEHAWTTPVGPDPGRSPWTRCTSVGHGPDEVLACTAGLGSALWQVVGPPRRLWIVDPRSGRLLAERPIPVSAQVAALGDRLLVALPEEGEGWRLDATDPVTGTIAWSFVTGSVASTLVDARTLTVLGDGAMLAVPGHLWSVAADGHLRATLADDDVQWWTPLRSGAVLGLAPRDAAGYRSALVMPDGRRIDTSEAALRVTPDDGTAPDLIFTTDRPAGGTLVARSAADGAVRWRADVQPTSGVLVDGRLYVGSADAVVALDARTGHELWRRHRDHPVEQLSTDGRVLVVTHGSTMVDTYALADGTLGWSQDTRDVLGTRVGSVGFYGGTGMLLATLDDGSVVALR